MKTYRPAADDRTGEGTGLRHRPLVDGALIWVDRLLEEPSPEWFDPAWLARHDCLRGEATGRGTTHFVCVGERRMVLRHYRRGGVLGDVLDDRYLWTGLIRTRPWRELAVQAFLHRAGLPVAAPLAARVLRAGAFAPLYRADLLTGHITGTETLTQKGARTPIDGSVWREIGEVIARFHAIGLEHADLNAHNILLAEDGAIYLIDFDRARLHAGAGKWALRNLVRLRRSLEKVRASTGMHFDDAAWDALTAGYEVARVRLDSAGSTSSMASR